MPTSKILPLHPFLATALLAASLCLPQTAAHAAAPSCWSLLTSKYGPGILHAVEEADPCAKMPGFEQKESFNLTGLDLCTAAEGVRIEAQADLACKSTTHGGLLKGLLKGAEMRGKLEASMTVDVGACRITDSHVSVSGPVGELLTSVGDIQGLARGFAQKKISEICGPH